MGYWSDGMMEEWSDGWIWEWFIGMILISEDYNE